jgi:hypothetical protein
MKKTYIAPELTQTIICANEIVCASTSVNYGGNAVANGIKSADVKGRDDFDFDGGSGSDWGDELW